MKEGEGYSEEEEIGKEGGKDYKKIKKEQRKAEEGKGKI